MIYGERIKQAREFKGLTQTQLANAVGVKQAAISEMEYNEISPSKEILGKIAEQTGFLPTFFELEPSENLATGSLNFRSRKTATMRQETSVYQYANLLYQQVRQLSLDRILPENRIPQLPNSPIQEAVRVTRDELNLNQTEPIKKFIRIVENSGVIILNIPRDIPKIDAFSTWAKLDEERPVIALLAGRTMDRIRFNVGHELGHLVLHNSLKYSLKLVENEANEFASNLLLPEYPLREEMKPPITLTLLAKLKLRWGVSMQALIMRAYKLGIITQRQSRYLHTQISSQGWKKKEPVELTTELPRLVRDMIESKYRTREDYAFGARMSLETATELYAYT